VTFRVDMVTFLGGTIGLVFEFWGCPGGWKTAGFRGWVRWME